MWCFIALLAGGVIWYMASKVDKKKAVIKTHVYRDGNGISITQTIVNMDGEGENCQIGVQNNYLYDDDEDDNTTEG